MHVDRPKAAKRFWLGQALLVTVVCLPAFAAVRCFYAELKTSYPKPLKSDVVASVTEVKGDVFYRNAGEFTFQRIKIGLPLKRFMTVYTASESWVSILYPRERSSMLSVPPESILRLEEEPPIGMLFRKGFTRSKSDFMMEAIKADLLTKDSEVIVSGVQDTGEQFEVESEEEERTKAVRFGLRMVFDMDRIPVTFPFNDLHLWTSPQKKSASIPIQFGVGNKSEPLQAFLWQLAPSAKIVWSGQLSARTRRVVLSIGNSGTFIFQAFGKSGTSRTRSIKIYVRREEPDLFLKGVSSGDSVVFN